MQDSIAKEKKGVKNVWSWMNLLFSKRKYSFPDSLCFKKNFLRCRHTLRQAVFPCALFLALELSGLALSQYFCTQCLTFQFTQPTSTGKNEIVASLCEQTRKKSPESLCVFGCYIVLFCFFLLLGKVYLVNNASN